MQKVEVQALAGSVVALVIGTAIAAAGSPASAMVALPGGGALPLFALCAIVAFGVQWVVFVPSFLARTEHFFDLAGSLTYLSLVAMAVLLTEPDPRTMLLAVLVTVWAVRLGTFLFVRVRQDGSDGRFDEIKQSFLRFLMAWTLQGLWVFLTLSCALAAMTADARAPIGVIGVAGTLLWLGGFAIEAVSDAQKRAFRADPANHGRFIRSGLWAWSRHPNYFGEITLWLGIALIAAEVLSGWQWVTLVSPLFVFVLLTRISGIPLLESRARKRWRGDPEYQAWHAATPALVPRPPRRR